MLVRGELVKNSLTKAVVWGKEQLDGLRSVEALEGFWLSDDIRYILCDK